MLEKIHQYCIKQFSLDTRALSLMRICLGLVLLADWIFRLNNFDAHYSTNGLMPSELLYAHNWKAGYYSIFLLSDSIYWQYTLFGIGILFSFFFLIGYFTRFATFIVWVLIVSIHYRNPYVLQGGDELLRITLFWCLFLPLANHYSIDKLQTNKTEVKKIFSAASVGFMLLVFSVYFFSALLKTSDEWRTEGSALYYALSLDQMALALGKILYNYPTLMKYITLCVFYLEIIAPLLFFFPFKNKYFRSIGIISLILLHIGIGSTLLVGLFFLIGISTLIGLFPTEAINWKAKYFPNVLFKLNPLPLLNKQLPKFSSLRNATETLKHRLSNFYTQTLITFGLIFIICICIIWNVGNIKGSGLTVSAPFKALTYSLGLHQDWGMFAPRVFKDDGWYVLDAHTIQNKQIDIYKDGQTTSLAKPESVMKYIRSDRWRKYEENFLMIDYEFIRPYYCKYALKQWNETHTEKIDSLSIIYMKERTLPNYEKVVPTKEVLCNCTTK